MSEGSVVGLRGSGDLLRRIQKKVCSLLWWALDASDSCVSAGELERIQWKGMGLSAAFLLASLASVIPSSRGVVCLMTRTCCCQIG